MLNVVESLSWAGSESRVNEDSCGAAGAFAWVIDGTIMGRHAPILHERSDAAWLANFISERLVHHASTVDDGPALVRRAIEDAQAAFARVAPPERQDPVSWPVAALSLVQAGRDRLDVWTLADTAAYVLDGAGRFHVAGEPAGLRQAESDLAARMLSQSGVSPEAVWEQPVFRDWLTDQRRRANTPTGVPLLGLVPAAADRMHQDVIPLAAPATILLATDGFSALSELYDAMSPREMVESAAGEGLEPLARRLREIERGDVRAERFPRFKVSDDATAILLRFG